MPIGQISMSFDLVVVVLTGLVFHDVTKALYTGVTVYICGKVIDAMVYRFDYSKVAMIISKEYDEIAKQIGLKLDRGATFLHGEGYSFVINTFDAGQKDASLDSLLASGALDDVEMIIGASYTKHNKELAKYAKERNIPLVIPFASKHDEAINNPMVYIVNGMDSL